jgi:hypothetical protein
MKCDPEEQCILQHWQLSLNNHPTVNPSNPWKSIPTTWSPPPIGFIKVNFDRACKGNPGPAGFGATLRNSDGQILCLVAGFIGENTNNVVELMGLLRGTQETIDNHLHNIILEGDSQIIIWLITKILHGEHLGKISPNLEIIETARGVWSLT